MTISAGTLLLIVWLVVTAYIIFTFIRRRRKVASKFPTKQNQAIHYRDRSASGYSTKSAKTRLSGANKTLEIVVTDTELWLKGGVFSASIMERNDLVHRIPLANILNANVKDRKVILNFRTSENEHKQVILKTRKPSEFLKAIKKGH